MPFLFTVPSLPKLLPVPRLGTSSHGGDCGQQNSQVGSLGATHIFWEIALFYFIFFYSSRLLQLFSHEAQDSWGEEHCAPLRITLPLVLVHSLCFQKMHLGALSH